MTRFHLRTLLPVGLALTVLLGCMQPMSYADQTPQSTTQAQPTQAQSLQAKQTQHQGIKGRVLRQSGNFMPTIQEPGATRPRNKTEPVQTRVWVFSGRIPAKGKFWTIAQAKQSPQLVKQVMSDRQGQFSVSLPPGEYTLFAQYGDKLYLNSFTGEGQYRSVQVKAGNSATIDLINREDATY